MKSRSKHEYKSYSLTKLTGQVQFIERYLRRLKSYVRKKTRPEGLITEEYIVLE